MLRKKFLPVLAAGLTGGVLLLTFGRPGPGRPANAATISAGTSAGVSAPTTPAINQDALTTFNRLITSPGTSSSTAALAHFNVNWLDWYTKCDVGLVTNCKKTGPGNMLEQSCQQDAPSTQPSAPGVPRSNAVQIVQDPERRLMIDALLKGFEKPAQTKSVKGSPPVFSDNKRPPPQAFASVLYNLKAACSLLKIAGGPNKNMYAALAAMQTNHQPEVDVSKIEDGAIVVKVIWEPTGSTFNSTDKPTIGVVPGGDLSKLPPDRLQDSLVKGSLPLIPQWLNFQQSAQIDFSAPDGNCGSPSVSAGSQVYSQACFSYISKAEYVAAFENNKPPVLSAAGELLKHQPEYLVLVGVNVMEFNRAEYPHWLWSSFWWAQDGGSYFSGLPRWQHFQPCAVHDVPSTSIGQDLCFNPYLEGVAPSVNGLVSNCLTCHQYAGFQQKTARCDSAANLPVHTQSGVCLGSPDEHGNVAGCSVNLDAYNKQTLLTHFLWSVGDANSPSLRANPPSSCPQ